MPKQKESAELRFDVSDLEAFKIRNARSRGDSVKEVFFPRLRQLIKTTVTRIAAMYGDGVASGYSCISHPQYRSTTRSPKFDNYVSYGLSRNRGAGPLQVKHDDGSPYHFASARLRFIIRPSEPRSEDESGSMWVSLWTHHTIFNQISAQAQQVIAGFENEIGSLFDRCDISPYDEEGDLELSSTDALRRMGALNHLGFRSAPRPFPLSPNEGLDTLVDAFAQLFPLFDVVTRCESGEPPRLKSLLAHRRKKLAELKEEAAENEANVEESSKRTTYQSASLKRDPKFRKLVMEAYEHRCAVCGLQLGLVEAAHIVAVKDSDRDGDTVDNGIALCALHHAALDRNPPLIWLDDQYRIRFDEDAVDADRALGKKSFQDSLLAELLGPRGHKRSENIKRARTKPE